MRKFFSTGLLAAAILSATSCSSDDSIQQAANESVTRFEETGVQNMENDALFIAEMASANNLLVQLGELASVQAVSPEVKNLAQRMQQEHRQVLDEINVIAEQGKFVLPATLGADHQKTYDEISARSGLQLDLAYIKEAVDSHKNLLKRYEDMAENGVTMEVKQFASKQVPLTRQHLEMAENLESKVNNI